MQNYNCKNPMWDNVPPFDFTVTMKQLRCLERDQSLIWTSMVESYQDKIRHLKQQMLMEKSQQNLTPIQLEIHDQYKLQCQQAANKYEEDLVQIAKKELIDKHKKVKCDVEEQIGFAKDNFQILEQKYQQSGSPINRDCEFIAGASSVYCVALAMKINSSERYFISIQIFQQNNYLSHYFYSEEVLVISVHDISVNKLSFASSNENIVSVYSVSYDQRKITNELIFQKEINCNVDLMHIVDQDKVIVIVYHYQGIVMVIGKCSNVIIYQGDHVINESLYFSESQTLQLSNNQRIISIQHILQNPKFDELQTEQYSGLIYYQINLSNFHLEYARYLQLLDEDSLLYVNSDNEIKVFTISTRTIKEFVIPTENIEIRFLTYLPKLNKLIFCQQHGQTFQIDKLKNLFN